MYVRVSLSRTMQTLSTLERRREESKAGEPQVLMGVDRGEKQEESGLARKESKKRQQAEEAAGDKTRRPSLVQV